MASDLLSNLQHELRDSQNIPAVLEAFLVALEGVEVSMDDLEGLTASLLIAIAETMTELAW